jgi:hypothetical protein
MNSELGAFRPLSLCGLRLYASAVLSALSHAYALIDRRPDPEYFEPDPFATEQPFIGDDLWPAR